MLFLQIYLPIIAFVFPCCVACGVMVTGESNGVLNERRQVQLQNVLLLHNNNHAQVVHTQVPPSTASTRGVHDTGINTGPMGMGIVVWKKFSLVVLIIFFAFYFQRATVDAVESRWFVSLHTVCAWPVSVIFTWLLIYLNSK